MDSTTLKREIGNRIHEYRISKGMTQAQFSECINISVNFLSELENGKKGLSSETLYNICNEFSVSADYILLGKSPSKADYSHLIELTNSLPTNELNTLSEYTNVLIKMRSIK